jgi:hypothetical protein
MAPFARLYHLAGLVGSHEANCIQRRLPAKSAASRCCTRSPVTKWIRAGFGLITVTSNDIHLARIAGMTLVPQLAGLVLMLAATLWQSRGQST